MIETADMRGLANLKYLVEDLYENNHALIYRDIFFFNKPIFMCMCLNIKRISPSTTRMAGKLSPVSSDELPMSVLTSF